VPKGNRNGQSMESLTATLIEEGNPTMIVRFNAS
jgi:hypothetical protein